jgi:hypothetical protein
MAAKENNHKSKDEEMIFFIQPTQLVSLDMEYYKFTMSCGTNWHCGSWLQLVSASSEEWTPRCRVFWSPQILAMLSFPAIQGA